MYDLSDINGYNNHTIICRIDHSLLCMRMRWFLNILHEKFTSSFMMWPHSEIL